MIPEAELQKAAAALAAASQPQAGDSPSDQARRVRAFLGQYERCADRTLLMRAAMAAGASPTAIDFGAYDARQEAPCSGPNEPPDQGPSAKGLCPCTGVRPIHLVVAGLVGAGLVSAWVYYETDNLLRRHPHAR